ncbi:WD40 repeat-like protein [Gigaspora margarita]|uniref:WD40 repeat-like protein n=1 Tax=Gigaspora margarita TaxID=4874 RepID=A0A8H4A2V6_GIGMA|nr:WD40 repeat-like protein [Gigaspora margarita]
MKDLEKENGQLLQRWLKKMNEEAERMNEANLFYERLNNISFYFKESSVVIVDKEFTPKPVTFTESGIGSMRTRNRSSAGPVIIPLAVAKKLTPHDGEIHTIQSFADGSMFATGSADKTIKIFDATTG